MAASPNPTTDQRTHHYESLRSGTIDTTDALGRSVLRMPWWNEPMNVQALPSGVYLLRLGDEHDRHRANGRFVKE